IFPRSFAMRLLGNANYWREATQDFPRECLNWSHCVPLSARRDGTSLYRAEFNAHPKNNGRAGDEPGDGDRAMATLVFRQPGAIELEGSAGADPRRSGQSRPRSAPIPALLVGHFGGHGEHYV